MYIVLMDIINSLLKTGNKIANINVKNCRLYTLLLTAMDRKPQNYKKGNVNHTNIDIQAMLAWLTLPFMIFAVFDPSPLTVCLNCSFFTFIQNTDFKCEMSNSAGCRRAGTVSRALTHTSTRRGVSQLAARAAGHLPPMSSVETLVKAGQIGRLAAVMETYRCQLRLLLLLTIMMMTVDKAAAFKSPFRGELSALPRGLDVLLRNVAPRSRTPARPPGNRFRPGSSPGKPL